MRTLEALRISALCFVVLSVGATPFAAQAVEKNAMGDVVFDAIEKRVIREVLGGASEDTDATTDDAGKGKGEKGKKKDKGDKSKSAKGKSGQLPPGLAKRGELPPGLQRGGALPPGLAKRSLPQSLEAQLPALPDGIERVIVDDNVVLMEKATNKVLDILVDVMRKP